MMLRRDFVLPESDHAFLAARGNRWEAVQDGASRWVIVYDHPVPAGYNHGTVALALLIPPAYPDAPLDMFYVRPALARSDGKVIKALSNQPICGDVFQRWSRHRTAANPWRVGHDDLPSHVVLVEGLLEREIGGLN
jgi:hypothetical protein